MGGVIKNGNVNMVRPEERIEYFFAADIQSRLYMCRVGYVLLGNEIQQSRNQVFYADKLGSEYELNKQSLPTVQEIFYNDPRFFGQKIGDKIVYWAADAFMKNKMGAYIFCGRLVCHDINHNDRMPKMWTFEESSEYMRPSLYIPRYSFYRDFLEKRGQRIWEKSDMLFSEGRLPARSDRHIDFGRANNGSSSDMNETAHNNSILPNYVQHIPHLNTRDDSAHDLRNSDFYNNFIAEKSKQWIASANYGRTAMPNMNQVSSGSVYNTWKNNDYFENTPQQIQYPGDICGEQTRAHINAEAETDPRKDELQPKKNPADVPGKKRHPSAVGKDKRAINGAKVPNGAEPQTKSGKSSQEKTSLRKKNTRAAEFRQREAASSERPHMRNASSAAKKTSVAENTALINKCIANGFEPPSGFKVCAIENDFNTVKVYIRDSGFKVFCCRQNSDDPELMEIYPTAQGFTDTGLDYVMYIFDIDFEHNKNKVIKPCIVAKTLYDFYELRERGKIYAE